ncbi:hypothetical protein SAMN04489724_0249 [Algoriphagus locisalis]|uniref:Uncharacterized protein n=1 Tax=Algoriphagus locisalis TaxID=305507 RepID=A0A1I7E842_9BACT|nr:hypothetical protein [Algoriphagus locisalis]SFU20136.1 hypothetical protein SAMN04489724_0249 [Algoriphagus locisalis]
MQLIYLILLYIHPYFAATAQSDPIPASNPSTENLTHLVYLQVGDRIVFDSVGMANATLSNYPNQLIFSIMDNEGQNISLTFAGKDISARKPTELKFDEPGLFHGYSEKGDVFFIAYGKFDPEREPGQIKYDTSFPTDIMEGRLTVINWTSEEFEFAFEGKLGKSNAVDNPESWQPFSGYVKAKNYLEFRL